MADRGLRTDATARLFTEIVTGQCVTPAASAEMMKLLARNPAATAIFLPAPGRAFVVGPQAMRMTVSSPSPRTRTGTPNAALSRGSVSTSARGPWA